MHHIVIPGFVDKASRCDCNDGQIDGEADWRTTSGKFELPLLARVMGVGRQQQQEVQPYRKTDYKLRINRYIEYKLVFDQTWSKKPIKKSK